MKTKISKHQFDEMRKSYDSYKDSFSNFNKLDKKTKDDISAQLVKRDSRSSVEIEHSNCLSSC